VTPKEIVGKLGYPLPDGWQRDPEQAAALKDIWPKILAHNEQIIGDAMAASFEDGVEHVAKLIDKKIADYASEHGLLDPETGVMEFSQSGEEYVSTLEELAEAIRASHTDAGGQ